MSRVISIDLREAVFNLRVEFVVAEIAGEIVEAFGERVPGSGVDAVAAILFNVVVNALAEIFVAHVGAGHAQHGKFFRQQIGAG